MTAISKLAYERWGEYDSEKHEGVPKGGLTWVNTGVPEEENSF